jgi:hypothetical protein
MRLSWARNVGKIEHFFLGYEKHKQIQNKREINKSI